MVQYTVHPIITAAEFASYAPEVDTSNYDPATISGMINKASQIVADFLDYPPIAQDITDETVNGRVSPRGDLLVFPTVIPIQSVSSLKIVRGSTQLEVIITDQNNNTRYNIDYQKRKLTYPFEEMTLSGTVAFIDFFSLKNSQFYTKLSYRGGFETSQVPESIKEATLLVLRQLFSFKFNPSGASEISQGGISLKYSMGKNTSVFLKQAKSLLAPYVR